MTSLDLGSSEGQTPNDHRALDRHIRRIVQVSPMLADLSQADILLLVPEDQNFRVVSHVRPMNARTVYPIDQSDKLFAMDDRPLASRAYAAGEIIDGGIWLARRMRWIRTLAVPVRLEGQVVAVLVREFSPSIEVMPGDLDIQSFTTFRRVAAMIAAGIFPFRVETRRHDHPPRVGDGLMLFDRAGRAEYASPNALSVLRQVGVSGVNIGQRFGDMGIDAPGMRQSFANRLDYTDEVEIGRSVLSTWCIPLLTRDVVTGALILVRNITELRQRDRLLMTKDAAIAEIHHRVKNSLQTASSLLQLQARRVDSDDARAAIAESARRIRSIGLVHELLAYRTDDEIQFREVLEMLTSMIRDSLVDPGHPVRFEIEADGAVLPNNLTTPLSLVASELIQNVIDHADASTVRIELRADPAAVLLDVHDDGVGFPENFSIDDSGRLGLTIVRTMVETELGGSLTITNDRKRSALGTGCSVQIRVPLFDERRHRPH